MRRSTRIQVRVPVSITGVLPGGKSFTEQAYVLSVSKYGARLKCRHPLSPGMEIRVKPTAGDHDAVYQVVWTGSGPDDSDEVGIQSVNPSSHFGISFPD